MASKGAKLGQMDVSVQIVRRDLLPPAPGSAEPKHSYTPILTTRAAAKSLKGSSQFAQVSVSGKAATHSFTIRYTTIPFDVRHRLRDASGQLYQILSVDNSDLGNQWMRILVSDQGPEDVVAAR